MNETFPSSTEDHGDKNAPVVSPQWNVEIVGGNVSGKNAWIHRFMGLVVLSAFAGVVIGVIVGVAVNNGDAGILTWLFVFLAGVTASGAYVFLFFERNVLLILDPDRVRICRGKSVIAQWMYDEIENANHDYKPNGVGVAAVLPSGMDRIRIEGQSKTALIEMTSGQATVFVDLLKSKSCNAIVSGNLAETIVPLGSDQPDRIWRKKLQMELRDSLELIGAGIAGTAILVFLVRAFSNGGKLQGPIGLFLILAVFALMGPFALFAGTKRFFIWLGRRKRFSELDREGNSSGTNQLLAELYSQDEAAQ